MGALAVGRSNEADGAGRQAGGFERRAQHLVDEDRHRTQGGAPGPEHRGIEALEELPRDVQRDVRSGLEVRTDRADRDAALAYLETVGQRPGGDLALERRDLRRPVHLLGETLDPARIQTEPVEQAVVEPALGILDVCLVGGQDRRLALPHERGGVVSVSATASSVSRGVARFASLASRRSNSRDRHVRSFP